MNKFQNLRDRLENETPSWADRNLLLAALGDSEDMTLWLANGINHLDERGHH